MTQSHSQSFLPQTCHPLKIAKFVTTSNRKEWKVYENRWEALQYEEKNNNSESEEWISILSKIIPSEQYLFHHHQDHVGSSSSQEDHSLGLKIGTFNVMFNLVPFFIKPIIRSRQRFAHTVQLLKQENFDILVLNEVTGDFLKVLQQDEFFKTNYYFSDIFQVENDQQFQNKLKTSDTLNESLGRKMGNLILSKYAPDYMYMELKIHESRPVIYAFFSHAPKTHPSNSTSSINLSPTSQLCVIGVHTTATTEFAQKRRHELLAIASHPLLQRAIHNDDQVSNHDSKNSSKLDVILMGDLNLHDEKEDVVISDMNFIDAWSETRTSKGYTFDSSVNDLVRWMFYGMEIRRMRLDRILIHRSSLCVPACKVKIFANRPLRELLLNNTERNVQPKALLNHNYNNIQHHQTKWKVPLWWKIIRFCLTTSTLMKVDSGYDYLFASDHFGLKMRIVRCDHEHEGNELKRQVLASQNNYCDFDETSGVDENDHDGMENGAPFSNHRSRVVVASLILLGLALLLVKCIL
ncbi:hypothetical protein C9374_012326 [Naegleria lovaniensis]|uniref:Endonuclease/exonuclease/phosphatase domain-containing protein n=1 Tax=Naegleria lovaniensis TaxID=51637 RepID=A0AA88GD19_NAELO|nr:uncharacterized protein C9374_012326 [Naegleria lovaniensis]KAG2373223.1 hypothetical protein C9374_012326 [Naegleria lovaniensis]